MEFPTDEITFYANGDILFDEKSDKSYIHVTVDVIRPDANINLDLDFFRKYIRWQIPQQFMNEIDYLVIQKKYCYIDKQKIKINIISREPLAFEIED